MELRCYQSRAVEAVFAQYEAGDQSTLVVLPTGGGKTVVAAHVAKRLLPAGRIMVVAHRDELIRQAVDKFAEITGVLPVVEKAGERSDEDSLHGKPPVVVSSVQTLTASNGRRLNRFSPFDFSLWWFDEAHHAMAATWMRVAGHAMVNPNAKILGVTATADRGDKKGLGKIFQSVAFNYELPDIINDGYLVPVLGRAVTIEGLDFSKVRTIAGDLSADDLEAAMMFEKPLHGVCHATIETAFDLDRGLLATFRDSDNRASLLAQTIATRRAKPTLIFAASVAHAYRLAEVINRWIPNSAASVDGTMTPESRKRVLRDFKEGRILFLCNCMVATEGFDAPHVELIVMARPTKSRSLYCLDDQTEILTEKGWRGINDELLADERAAAFDLSDGSIHWSPVEAQIRRPMETVESMYGIESPHTSIRVTNQHRMVIREKLGKRKALTNWKFATAQELAASPKQTEIPVSGYQQAKGIPLTDDEIRFIGLWMTDGCLNRSVGQVTLYQSDRYPSCIEYIERVLAGCNFKNTRSSRNDATAFGERKHPVNMWTISKGLPRGTDKHKRGWGSLEQFMDKELPATMEHMTREQLLVLIEAMNIGDGTKNVPDDWKRHTLSICTSRRRLADRLQSLCVRRGIRCNIGIGGTNGRMLMLHIRTDKSAWSISSKSSDTRPVFGKVEGAGRVWCIQVETGAIVTRRNGKVAIVGNCQMVGRGTRPAASIAYQLGSLPDADARRGFIASSEKPSMLALDFVGNTGKHKLVTTADLLGGESYDPEIIELARKKTEETSVNVLDALADAKEEVERKKREAEEKAKQREEAAERRRQTEAARRAKLVGTSEYATEEVNPMDRYAVNVNREQQSTINRPDVSPRYFRACVGAKVEDRNLAKMPAAELERLGKEIIHRHAARLCTYKQGKVLIRAGYSREQVKGMTKAEARTAIDYLASHNWQRAPEVASELYAGVA